jgi:hypothetical protein
MLSQRSGVYVLHSDERPERSVFDSNSDISMDKEADVEMGERDEWTLDPVYEEEDDYQYEQEVLENSFLEL